MRGRTDLIASAAYQPEPSAAAAARRFVRQTLQSWDIAERSQDADRLVDDAVLLTSGVVVVDPSSVHVFEPGETGMNLNKKGGRVAAALTNEPAHALA